MQIHDLPAQTTAASADVLAIDSGTSTQKITVANLGKKVLEGFSVNTITTETLNSLTGRATYIAQISNTTAAAIGLPSVWFYVLNISRPTSDGWCYQMFFEVGGSTRIYVRNSGASSWNAVKQLQFVS